MWLSLGNQQTNFFAQNEILETLGKSEMCGFFVPEDIKNFGITENIYLFSTHPVMGALRTAYMLNGISFAYTTQARFDSASAWCVEACVVKRIYFLSKFI